MRTRLAQFFLAAALSCGLVAAPTASFAQSKKGATTKDKKGAKDDKGKDKGKVAKEVNLDEGGDTPVTAGQMTEEAAQGKRLFDGERWSEAALVLKRVVDGETGDDEGNKQIAQYHLAICLYRLQFYQASYGIFSAIADKPNHLKFNETLLWLSKLATQLPEPADIIERVGKYNESHVAKFDNNEQAELYWQLNYLLGRYRYRNGKFQEALALFGKVNRKSKNYVEAQFFAGISNVQMRQSKPAVEAFQRILGAIDEGDVPAEDEARFRDLAYLSMARKKK